MKCDWLLFVTELSIPFNSIKKKIKKLYGAFDSNKKKKTVSENIYLSPNTLYLFFSKSMKNIRLNYKNVMFLLSLTANQ